MAKEEPTDQQRISSHFEKQLGHAVNVVLSGLILWIGSSTIASSTGLVAAQGRIEALEASLQETKKFIQDGTEDRFKRSHADAAHATINKALRDHERELGYLNGIIKNCVKTE